MKRYYSFSLDELGDMSLYQFVSYLDEIPETMKMLSGDKLTQEESTDIEDLISMAKSKGIKIPTKY